MSQSIKTFFNEALVYPLLTPFIIFDYFPNISPLAFFDRNLFLYLYLGIILLSILLRSNKESTKLGLKVRIMCIPYVLSLLLVLPLLGGVSSSGISLSHPILWFFVLLESHGIYKEWRPKEKAEESM